MRVRVIDERDSSGLVEVPVFRVLDWVGEAALRGETTASYMYEVDGATITEVIEWAVRDREPAPSLSEIYATVADPDGVTLVYLGSLERRRGPGGDIDVAPSTLRL